MGWEYSEKNPGMERCGVEGARRRWSFEGRYYEEPAKLVFAWDPFELMTHSRIRPPVPAGFMGFQALSPLRRHGKLQAIVPIERRKRGSFGEVSRTRQCKVCEL